MIVVVALALAPARHNARRALGVGSSPPCPRSNVESFSIKRSPPETQHFNGAWRDVYGLRGGALLARSFPRQPTSNLKVLINLEVYRNAVIHYAY